MTVRQILKFRFTCDGYKPTGQPCWCHALIEEPTLADAETTVKGCHWHQDWRGWLCNMPHRDDP